MITVQGITKTFGKYTALEEFSFEAPQGRIHGIVGYNGAGKTTLMKIIAGIYRPEKGKVLLDGVSIYENEEIKQSLFMVQDEPYFTPQGTLNSLALLYSGYYPGWSFKTFKHLVDFFSLDPGKRVNGFSKGMQRQASLVLALACRPQCLLLDESFDGLDLIKRKQLKKLLFAYREEWATHILISSHNLRELEGLCDHVALIRDKGLYLSSPVDKMQGMGSKYFIVFEEGNEEEKGLSLIKAAGAKNTDRDGYGYTFLWEGSQREAAEVLEPIKPKILEQRPLSLEEIFLEDEEDKSYDFKSFFIA